MLCISRSSAVGSALRSGRRGRAFESPLLDKRMVLGPSFLFGDSPPSGFSATIVLSIIAVEAIFESPLLDKKDSLTAVLFVCYDLWVCNYRKRAALRA